MGLMVTVESTFWFHVIKAKYFPPKSAEEKEETDQFLHDIRAVITGYKTVWMRNYGRSYSAIYLGC